MVGDSEIFGESVACCQWTSLSFTISTTHFWLVVLAILKNLKVNGKEYIMGNKKCLKPPTRLCCFCFVNKWTTSVGIVPLDQLPGDIARHRQGAELALKKGFQEVKVKATTW